MPGYAFRHCYYQGYVTPTANSGEDHLFKIVSALSSTPYAVSFESINFPGYYLATNVNNVNSSGVPHKVPPAPPVATVNNTDTDTPNLDYRNMLHRKHSRTDSTTYGMSARPGIVKAPAPLEASWLLGTVSSRKTGGGEGGGGGFTLTSVSPLYNGTALAMATYLNGTCAGSYTSPSKAITLSLTAPAWNIIDSGGGGGTYPPRAACVIQTLYDQTGNGNHLLPATPAINNPAYDNPVNATRHSVKVGHNVVYGAYFETGTVGTCIFTSYIALPGTFLFLVLFIMVPSAFVAVTALLYHQTLVLMLGSSTPHCVSLLCFFFELYDRHGLPRAKHVRGCSRQRSRDHLHGHKWHAHQRCVLLRLRQQ